MPNPAPTLKNSATAVILSSSQAYTFPFLPDCLRLPVRLGPDQAARFGGTLQPLQQAVDPTHGVAGPILLCDPISNLPSGPKSACSYCIGYLVFLLQP